MLRPGPELFRRVGGIHNFMGWQGPVLTDSGGYQIFSLPGDRTLSEEGARFRGYTDQRIHVLSPERSIAMQTAIGSDIMMVLDVCVDSRSDEAATRAAMERTHRWALRSLAARDNPEQALFAIVQGGVVPELRRESAAFLTGHPFDGFAIGGLAVGDARGEREDVTHFSAELLPADRPRYLMGVGTPPDLLQAMLAGVDHVRLRLADAPRLAGDGLHVHRPGAAHARAERALRRARWTRRALAPRAARRAAPTCTTSSSAASRSVRGCCRFTTCTTTTGSWRRRGTQSSRGRMRRSRERSSRRSTVTSTAIAGWARR